MQSARGLREQLNNEHSIYPGKGQLMENKKSKVALISVIATKWTSRGRSRVSKGSSA
jgi:hypothetical protein